MKTKAKTFIDLLHSPERQRIILIDFPLLALVICSLILLPHFVTSKKQQINAVSPSTEVVESTNREIVSATPEIIAVQLPLGVRADAQGSELHISLLDESSSAVEGYNFELSLIDDSGNEFIYYTSEEGKCHIVELKPGEYTLSILPQHGYGEVREVCTVGSNYIFTRISDTTSMRGWSTEITHHGWKTENGKTYFIDSNGSAVTGFVRIDEKLHYFNEWGEKAKALGIDVSYYNGRIDWEAVKAEGIDFVIIRTGGRGWSSGKIYEDSTAFNYLLDAKAAGLDVGIYFYSTAVNTDEAVDEAHAVLARLNNIELDYPIYIDMEFSGQYPGGRADILSKAERMEIASAFFTTVEKCGYKAGLYSSQYYLNTAIDHWSLGSYSIWIANYIEGLTRPNFYGKYDIWQFTDKARINGIVGPVDMNIHF